MYLGIISYRTVEHRSINPSFVFFTPPCGPVLLPVRARGSEPAQRAARGVGGKVPSSVGLTTQRNAMQHTRSLLLLDRLSWLALSRFRPPTRRAWVLGLAYRRGLII